MKGSIVVLLLLYSFQSCWSQGTLDWNWIWTGTNNQSDAGSGLLVTGPDNGNGVFNVLNASGNINGHSVIGVSGNVYGFLPQQTLAYPLGTSGGTHFTQFVFALSQGCYEMVEDDQESILQLPTGQILDSPAKAESSFWDSSGSSVLNQGVFSIQPTPEPCVSSLITIGLSCVMVFHFRRRNAQTHPHQSPIQR